MMKAENDYERVVEILKSCQNSEQIQTTKNMFENFKKKWNGKIYDLDLISFMYKFEIELKKIKL